MLTVPEIINQIYEKWGEAVREKVGDNFSMENSTVINDLPYASLFFLGLPSAGSTLEGGESGVSPTAQVDIYTTGQRALSNAYEIDNVSHNTLLQIGFQRNYGPELIQSTDPSVKRLTSRYERIVGFGEEI